MSQLRQREDELASLGVVIKVITFDDDRLGQAYVRSRQLSWPMLLDRDRALYTAYAMHRETWWTIYNPISVFHYLKLIFAGKPPGKPGCDWRQMGGDVLIDPLGNVQLHHVSCTPHDRPTVDAIIDVIRGA